jgi:hypothetical protein
MQTTKKMPSLIFILVGAVLAGYLGYLINGAWTEGIAFNEFMDEKDLNENEEKLTDVNNDSVDSGLEEKDGVKYETSDNWEFDAKAPTLDENLVMENQDYSISFDKVSEPKPTQASGMEDLEDVEMNKFEKWLTDKLGDKFMNILMGIATVLGFTFAFQPQNFNAVNDNLFQV